MSGSVQAERSRRVRQLNLSFIPGMPGIWLCMWLCLSLLGCGAMRTKHDIATRAEGIKTTKELENVLGKPDKYDVADVPILGRVETYTYKASDGEMTFTSHNGKIQLRVSDGAERHRRD